MKLRPLVLLALLLLHSPTWAGICASLIAPVIAGRGLGAQIRSMVLAESKSDDDKGASIAAGRLLEIIGTEIQQSSPHFFLDESDRESAFMYLDTIAQLAPEVMVEQVQKFRELLLTHNLYYARYMAISAAEFGSLTQSGRHHLLLGVHSRQWLETKKLDPELEQFKELQLPERLRGFEEKTMRIKSIELASLTAINNREGLIGYQAWYTAELDGKPIRFEFYFTPDFKPMVQEVRLTHLHLD